MRLMKALKNFEKMTAVFLMECQNWWNDALSGMSFSIPAGPLKIGHNWKKKCSDHKIIITAFVVLLTLKTRRGVVKSTIGQEIACHYFWMGQVFNIQIWWVFWYYYSLSIFFRQKLKHKLQWQSLMPILTWMIPTKNTKNARNKFWAKEWKIRWVVFGFCLLSLSKWENLAWLSLYTFFGKVCLFSNFWMIKSTIMLSKT